MINPKNKIQFYKKFDEITGNSAIQIRLDKETVYWGYLGLRLKTAREVTEQKTLDKTTKGEILKIIKEFDNDDARLEEIKAFVTKVL